MSRVQNRERLLAKMAALPPAIRREMAAAIQQGADEIVALQKRLAPKKSGRLRDSIVATKGGGGPKYAAFQGKGGEGGDPDLTVRISAGNAAVRYAHLIEFGTAPHLNGGLFAGSQHPGTAPEPFFYPAYRALKRKVKSRVSRATKKAIKAIAK